MAESTADWFVAPDTKGGDGSRAKPFHDPWQAFHAAGPGDTVHIAAGTYYGRYNRSSWIIDSPNLTVRGGYSRDFSKRTPWQTPSVFAADPEFEYVRENNLIAGGGNHSGLTLDGLFFDGAGRNTYDDSKPVEGLQHYPTMDGAIASFNGAKVTIKNCVFANSATGGIELSGDGSRFENNFVINLIGIGMLHLRKASGDQPQLLTVTGNTFCFTFDTAGPPFGKGADNAIGVRVNCPAVVQNNVFISCGNAGIALYRDLDRITIDGNLFYLTPHDVVASRAQGVTADLVEKNIDELEDVGLKSAAGNVVQDPGLTGLKPEWLDAATRHLLANYATPPFEAANAVRAKASLPALTPADLKDQTAQGKLAPRLAVSDALATSFTAKQGFHAVELPVQIAARAPEAAATYKPIDWSAITTPNPALANQRVELRVGLGYEQNATLLEGLTPETYMGIRLYQPFTDDGSIFVLAKRSTLVNRQFEEAIKSNNGREVESTYFVRGVYRADIIPSSFQKVTLVVESIVPAPIVVKETPHPQGRDWFVKAGASGGDGTKEKPFRDPFQALDKAEGGDTIHVAGGDYVGKLHSGQWKILIRNLTLLGGYNAEFSERDPWKNPTRFVLDNEEKAKGTRQGKLLDSEENSEGLVLDGFIFDGATYNNYAPNGSLDLGTSPTDTLVSLRGSQSPITVRNCFFLNTPTEAVSISSPSGIFENNILVNTSGWSLKVNANGMGPWIIRNNTFLFAGDPSPRAGTGLSSPDGTLLLLTGRASTVVEGNILAFADNYGVRCGIASQNVSFVNNVFAGNLHNHLTDERYLWADGSNWDRCMVEDSSFATVTGNTFDLPALPVDPAFADVALKRLFVLPSRISQDLWKTLAAKIGSSAKPAAPSTPAVETKPDPAKAVAASLSDLIASLGTMKSAPKPDAPPAAKPEEPSGPVYFPIFDWKKALALAQDAPGGAGAHKQKLTVSFSAAAAHAEVQYTTITAQDLEKDLAPLEGKPIELEIAEARDSSTNPFFYPPGTTKNDYSAYSVAWLGDSRHTRVAIIIRQDTAASKFLSRITPTDKLRVRGTARVLSNSNPGAIAIVVDKVELGQKAR